VPVETRLGDDDADLPGARRRGHGRGSYATPLSA
jgi:hypothetical protein